MAEAAAQAPPTTPRSPEELDELMNSTDQDMDSKKATLMRGLDFYAGVDWMENGNDIEIPVGLDGKREILSYSEVSPEYLCERLKELWKEAQAQS